MYNKASVIWMLNMMLLNENKTTINYSDVFDKPVINETGSFTKQM